LILQLQNRNFLDNLEILKELEYAESYSLNILYWYKKSSIFQQLEGREDIIREYKSGSEDPSRFAAQKEKLAAIKKMVGKKKRMNDMI
jgi:hypothetical protein